MSRLPLSAKVALWSFVLAAITLGTAVFVTTIALERELMVPIEERFERLSSEIFSSLHALRSAPDGKFPTLTPEMLPRGASTSHIEILDANGAVLYRSPTMKDRLTLKGGQDEPHIAQLFKQPYYIRPFHDGGVTLLLAHPLAANYNTLARVKTAGLYALPVAGLLSVIGGYWLAGRALKPVRKITEAAARITANDLHQRIPLPPARDEIRLLTKVLNDAFERLERSYLQAVRFASDASHQLKTPVTVMRAAIEALLADHSLRPEQSAALDDLLEQTRRLSSLTEGLLLLARADAGGIKAQPDEVDLLPILERCIEDAEVLGSHLHIQIERDVPARLRALADPGRTEQILLNLLENAVKYNRENGVISIRAGERRDGVFIAVLNTGDQIPNERIPWIFDRFSRGGRDESRAGHGLGLSIAKELANAQGGDVRLLHSDAGGTEFELRLASVNSKITGNPLMPLMTPHPSPAAYLRIPG
jgi:signal transduction histidine kinase